MLCTSPCVRGFLTLPATAGSVVALGEALPFSLGVFGGSSVLGEALPLSLGTLTSD